MSYEITITFRDDCIWITDGEYHIDLSISAKLSRYRIIKNPTVVFYKVDEEGNHIPGYRPPGGNPDDLNEKVLLQELDFQNLLDMYGKWKKDK